MRNEEILLRGMKMVLAVCARGPDGCTTLSGSQSPDI